MAAISQQLADITVLSIVVRILLSTFCAGTLGFERERHNQAAGFRTYIIVSDASALCPRISKRWIFTCRRAI